MFLIASIILTAHCLLFSGGISFAAENQDVDFVERLLSEVTNLNHKLLDLKRKQDEMEQTTTECKSLLERYQIYDSLSKPDSTDTFAPGRSPAKRKPSKTGNITLDSRIQNRSPNSFVAFFADLTIPHTTLGRSQIVIYDRIQTDIGGAYNKNDGIFTAPVTGTYTFSYTCMASPTHIEELELAIDGIDVAHIFCGSASEESTSQTVALYLNRGNQVWIRTHTKVGDGQLNSAGHNTFTGWLIHSDE